MSSLHVLLPPLASLGDAPAWRCWLARGNRLPDTDHARRTLSRELFRFPGSALPAAALRHHWHARDPQASKWLCADPCWVRSEATDARLLAWPMDDLSADDAEQLALSLRPLFGDAGVPLVVDAPSAWCVRLADGAPTAAFTDPVDGMGVALLDCLPSGDAGRKWRQLFTEAQILLHAHPVNAARVAAGLRPINALWFWGAGALPMAVETGLCAVATTDDVLRGLAKLAKIEVLEPVPAALQALELEGDVLLDAGAPQHTAALADWLPLFQRWLRERRFAAIALNFASGERFCIRHVHRLRFWRRG